MIAAEPIHDADGVFMIQDIDVSEAGNGGVVVDVAGICKMQNSIGARSCQRTAGRKHVSRLNNASIAHSGSQGRIDTLVGYVVASKPGNCRHDVTSSTWVTKGGTAAEPKLRLGKVREVIQ